MNTAIAMKNDDEGLTRLKAYAAGGHHLAAEAGFWSEQDLAPGA